MLLIDWLIDCTFAKLGQSLTLLFKQKIITPQEYMKVYTIIYDYCASPCDCGSRATGYCTCSKDGKTSRPALLYKEINRQVLTYLAEVVKELSVMTGEELVTGYYELWHDFQFCAKAIHGMCLYLNENWLATKRLTDEAEHDTIYMVCLKNWKQQVHAPLEAQLTWAVLETIAADRNGSFVSTQTVDAVRKTVDGLVDLDSKLTYLVGDPPGPEMPDERVRTLSEVYKSTIHTPFLADSLRHYTAKIIKERISPNQALDRYILQVYVLLTAEELRCTKYLHESTRDPLMQLLVDLLIFNPKATLFPTTARDKAQLGGDPKTFVTAIWEAFDRNQKILEGVRQHQRFFSTTLDKVFWTTLNTNAVPKQAGTVVISPAELIARYCDALLKKGTTPVTGGALEASLSRVGKILRYLEDREAFQKHHRLLLSKRLLFGLSWGPEYEYSLLQKIKVWCSAGYDAKLQAMLQDVVASREVSELFAADYARDHALGYDFSVQALRDGAWPLTKPSPLNIPIELERPLIAFREYYQTKYSRKITWNFPYSRCEISTNCFSSNYILQGSAYHAAILMCYETGDDFTVDAILTILGCEQGPLTAPLLRLLRLGILLAVNATGQSVPDQLIISNTTAIKLNLAFKSSKQRINLNAPLRR
ncbi:Cullin-1 [Hypsibius exemplaris]|uniref:Cullin-1 n=1 Tax=Hypsibius exemplaris TaxID=2072580 RepID=A0A1W0XD08_HYPEX|nr:Cullin-1 [Hypsibius exemplaris]